MIKLQRLKINKIKEEEIDFTIAEIKEKNDRTGSNIGLEDEKMLELNQWLNVDRTTMMDKLASNNLLILPKNSNQQQPDQNDDRKRNGINSNHSSIESGKLSTIRSHSEAANNSYSTHLSSSEDDSYNANIQ